MHLESDSGAPPSRSAPGYAYIGPMIRKLLWLMALLALVGTVTGVVDRAHAVRRRELWAEATESY